MPVELEYKTMKTMIKLFCRHHHKSDNFCKRCSDLLEYAEKRLVECPFGKDKPTCNVCQVQCYSPEMKKLIVKVMRFSGPRMIFLHPVMTLRHLIRSRRSNKSIEHNK
ncbi:MAG: nitrous oxide-stimulated promoter family protein [bacterium]|nr:nitrous oxide-stimulated promoter family protein [bacterium]